MSESGSQYSSGDEYFTPNVPAGPAAKSVAPPPPPSPAPQSKPGPPMSPAETSPRTDSCSSRQFTQSDKATGANFSSSEAGGASSRCEPPSPPAKQCDLDDLILNSVPINRQQEYKRFGGKWVAQPFNPGTRAISLQGLDRSAPAQMQLEVVGDRPGVSAATRIRTMVHPFAAHDSSHVLVTVTRPNEVDLVKACPSNTVFEFPVYRSWLDTEKMSGCDKAKAGAKSLFQRYWSCSIEPARYVVTAQSCGLRNCGDPVTGGSLDVLVYPYDQYSITLTIPPLRRRAYSKAVARMPNAITTAKTEEGSDANGRFKSLQVVSNNNDGSVKEIRNHTSDDLTIKNKTRTTTLEDGSELTTTDFSEEDRERELPTLEFKKNGATEDLGGGDLIGFIDAMRTVEKRAAFWEELVRKYTPQVGFKFDVSLSFMQGAFSLAWGWKEYKDWRAYFAYSAAIRLWLFRIGLSLSFGISAGPTTIKVSGEIKDGGVYVESQWNVKDPDHHHLPATAKAKGVIPIEIKGDAAIDIHVARASATAGLRSGFYVEGGTRLNSSSALELYADIAFTGVDAFVQTQKPGGGLKERMVHLIDPKTIWTGGVPL